MLHRRDCLKLTAAACLAGTGAARAADLTLRLGSVAAASSPPTIEGVVPFARRVEQQSGGALAIAEKPAGGYGKPSELFAMLERGEIDMAYVVHGYSPGRFPRTSVMELPMMFATAPAGTAGLNTLFRQGLLDGDYSTVKVLGLHAIPPYGLFTTGKMVNDLRDLRGLRVRTGSLTTALALSRLGMVPLGMPSDLVAEMLSNGTLDAITFGWDTMSSMPTGDGKMLIDQVKILVDANLAGLTALLAINRQKWDTLSPDLQSVLEQEGQAFSTNISLMLNAREDRARAHLKSDPAHTYVAISDEVRAAMVRTVMPVVTTWKSSVARQGLDGEALYAAATAAVKAFNPSAS